MLTADEGICFWQVPKDCIEHAVRDWPLILGCSAEKLMPMVEQLDQVGVRTTKLGEVIRTSSQLLYHKPEEFQKVACSFSHLP